MSKIEELRKENQYVMMPEDEAWEFMESYERQIASLTTMSSKGWPITVPIIFIVHERKIYFVCFKWKGKILHKKIRDMNKNPIVNIMSETGWTNPQRSPEGYPDLKFVSIVGTAKIVADPEVGDLGTVESFWYKFREKYLGERRDVESPTPVRHGPSAYLGLPPEEVIVWYEVTPIRIYNQAGYTKDSRMMQRLEKIAG